MVMEKLRAGWEDFGPGWRRYWRRAPVVLGMVRDYTWVLYIGHKVVRGSCVSKTDGAQQVETAWAAAQAPKDLEPPKAHACDGMCRVFPRTCPKHGRW
jgi:hypothetical protein